MTVRFASWVRTGLVASQELTLSGGSLGVEVAAKVNQSLASAVRLELAGPGDVTGIDSAQIIRTEPHLNAEGFETTRFVSVEFRRADLPWMFTPGTSTAKLRPWLVLVVVPVGAHAVTPQKDRLPELKVDASQLPTLSESWAWAHAQANTVGGATPDESSRSRLICPRSLQPFTRYVAAIVPSTMQGVNAGLHRDPTATGDAWGASGEVTLPMYFHWYFSTGEGGDFESLARGLTISQASPAGLGAATLDTSAPGPTTLQSPGRLANFRGPLAQSGSTPINSWSLADRHKLESELVPPPNTSPPVLAPPRYGAVAAGESGFPATGNHSWITELNTNPELRVCAGLGAAIVRRRQHDFVQEAWEQAGAVADANRRLAQARLSRRVATLLNERHVKPRSEAELLMLASPLLRRVVDPQLNATVAGHLRTTSLPLRAVGPAFRRLTRTNGPLTRRVQVSSPTPIAPMANAVQVGLAARAFDHSRVVGAGGLPTLGGVLDVVKAATSVPPGRPPVRPGLRLPGRPGPIAVPGGQAIEVALRDRSIGARSVLGVAADPAGGGMFLHVDPGSSSPVRVATIGSLDDTVGLSKLDLAKTREGAIAAMKGRVLFDPDGTNPIDITAGFKDAIGDLLGTSSDPVRATADLTRLAARVSEVIEPHRAITEATLVEVTRPPGPDDQLDSVLVAPTINEPLWDDLAAMSTELLLPGASKLEREHAAVVSVDKTVVAAILAGANDEMMRELRWRGYPTDGRGTIFRRFWDRRDNAGAPQPDLARDIHTWQGDLAAQAAGPTAELVLVVRSELFRRFPGTLVTLVRATATAPNTPRKPDYGSSVLPRFHGNLGNGVAFYGFPISLNEAVGDPTNIARPGAFLVFHQPPTDLGFGLDLPLADSNGAPTWPSPASLGTDSARIASALAQLPVRLALHVSDLMERQ